MTHWRTHPVTAIDEPESSDAPRFSSDMSGNAGNLGGVGALRSSQSTRRPQIYVHVEFGVSWSPRHLPNNHAVTYRSRGLRDQLANFPRQVPAPNTNYLANPGPDPAAQAPHASLGDYSNYAQQDPQRQRRNERHALWESLELQRRQSYQPPSDSAQRQAQSGQTEYQQWLRSQQQLHYAHLSASRHRSRMMLPIVDEERSSRSSRGSPSSHERGHSEPPPLSGSPWDITSADASGIPLVQFGVGGYAVASSSAAAEASRRTAAPAQIWKDLPEVPSRYRLGEDNLPWSFGLCEPAADPDDERLRPHSQPEPGVDYSSLDPYPIPPFSRNHPTVVPIQPSPQPPPTDDVQLRSHDINAQRRRELEALSAAMMTVDNGFENQWWNQGPRVNTDAAQAQTSASALPTRSDALAPPAPTIAAAATWPGGMSASALPLPSSSPLGSFRGTEESASERGQKSSSSPSSAVQQPERQPQRTSTSLPSSPSEPTPPPRRIQMASLGWAIATSPPQPRTASAVPEPHYYPYSAIEPSSQSAAPWAAALPTRQQQHSYPQRNSSLNYGHGSSHGYHGSGSSGGSGGSGGSHNQHVVSPVSSSDNNSPWSPAARGRHLLNRSMSTRSDELFLTGGRYA